MIISDIILRVQYNGSTYDLNVDKQVPLRIDMSAVEVGRVGEFFGVGSQTFALAGTKENNRFFNHAYDVAQDDVPAMYNTLPCSVLLNGETMIVGSVTLLSVVAGDDGWVTYNVQVADKVIQFEEGLASKLIKDANWSGYTHTLNSGSIVDSWEDNLLGGSVYYPMVDYGRDAESSKNYSTSPIFSIDATVPTDMSASIAYSGNPAKMRQFLPAIKVKDTLDVIFQQAGFNYTGSFTETDDFNNLYILNKPGKGLGVQLSGSSIATFSANQGNPQAISTYGSDVLVEQNLETFDPSNSYSTSTMEYTCPTTGEYSLTGRIGVNLASIGNSGDKVSVEFRIKLNSGGGWTTLNETFIILGNSSGTYELTLPYNAVLGAGQRIALFVQFTKLTSFTGSILLNNASSLFTATQAPATYNNATVDMALQWEPKTKSIDVLKGILEQFNLVMTPKEGDRHTIEIETFDDWMRAGEIVDWTNRYDTAKRIKVEHTVSKLQKELFLKNKDDVDRFSKITIDSDPNEQYGTLRILADNTVSQGTKKIGNYFAPVVLGGAVDYIYGPDPGGQVFEGSYDINLNTEFILPHLYKFENNKQESYTTKPRIGYKVSNSLNSGNSFYIGTSAASNIEVTGSYATIANVSSLPVLPGFSNDLHYNNTYSTFTNVDFNLREGKNNFENYWKDYIDSIYWEGSKKVTLDLFFEPYEYQTIRLNSRILIKGQAYRINQIKGFNVTHRDVVTVELIKLYPAYWQVENPLPCEGDVPYQFPNLELRTDDCTTLGPTPIIARTLEFYNVGDYVYTIEDGSETCYRVVGTSTSAHTRTIDDGVSPLADCLTCNNLPTPTPLPTATNTPGPSPTPVPTATPVPQNCRIMVIGANASGDAIQVIGTCCDGTPFIEQEEDFASVEVCVDPAEIPNFTITSSGTGFWYLSDPCAGGC